MIDKNMQEQAQKVHEVLRAALDGKHIRTSSCARCYQDGERDMLAMAMELDEERERAIRDCIAAVEALDVCWYVDDCCQSPNHGILNDVYLALRALAENA